MSMKLCFAIGLVAASSLVAVAVPGAALAVPAPVVTTLPIAVSSGADVVAAGDREFISGGGEGSQIAVADAAGAIVGTIDGLPGPTDLALTNDRRTLFVALPSAHAIAAFDTGTLIESARYDTGADGACPSYLALTGRYLWFGYGCSGGDGDIGRIDLGRQPAPVTLGMASSAYFYSAPMLASALRNNAVLLAGEVGLSPGTVHSLTIAAGTLTEVTTSRDLGSNLGDLALDPSGTTAWTAQGSPYYFPAVTAADLVETGLHYQADAYPLAVEASRDGTELVGGINGYYEPDVYVYTVGNPTPLATFETGQLMPHSLAWAPNGRKIYALTASPFIGPDVNAKLHVIPVPKA
jgi:hypothetical protein